MKNIFRNTTQYLTMIFKRAFHIVWVELEMKGLVITTVIIFMAALFAYLAYYLKVIPVETATEAFQQAVFQAWSAGVAVIIFTITFLFVFAYVPVKIYNEQNTEIERIKKQIRSDVKLTLFPYTPNPNPEGDRWIGVKIINKSGTQAIERCKAKLYAVNSLPGTPAFFGGQELPADLRWSENNPPDNDGYLKIPRDGEVSLDIARSRNQYQEGSLLLARGDNFLKFAPGRYLVIFRIDGAMSIIDGGMERLIEIPPQQYSAEIILHKGFNLGSVCKIRNSG